MPSSESFISYLKQLNERYRDEIEDFRNGVLDIRKRSQNGEFFSVRDETIDEYIRRIKSNESIINRLEAGER